MIRPLAFALLLTLTTGCASGPTPGELIQYAYLAVTRKVLMFAPTPCRSEVLVSAWVRESDIHKMTVVCDVAADGSCSNCRLVKLKKGQRAAAGVVNGHYTQRVSPGVCR